MRQSSHAVRRGNSDDILDQIIQNVNDAKNNIIMRLLQPDSSTTDNNKNNTDINTLPNSNIQYNFDKPCNKLIIPSGNTLPSQETVLQTENSVNKY